MRRFPLALLVVAAAAACSSSSSDSTPSSNDGDAGPIDHYPGGDEGGIDPGSDGGADADEPLPEATEKEPNDGKTTTEVDSMQIPGVMHGAIDPADDVDIFSVTPAAGELWEWTLAPTGADLAPHLTVFDTAKDNLNPTVLAKGDPGATATIQHFVLGGGQWVAVVRDARNVPTASGKGGSTYGYTLTAKKKTPSPITVTLPSTKTGTLASLSSIDLYSFTATAGMGLDVIVKAERKTQPSTLDSRLSIFDMTTNKAVGTNDDAKSTSDSELGGTFAAGTYLVIVENEGTNATDLSYEISFTPR